MSAIELSNVTKRFDRVTPIRDFTLSVAPGSLCAVLGPSGCGKTTLLRLVAGLEIPDHGTISLNGRVVSAEGVYVPPMHRGLGMAFQDFALWPHKTVQGHLQFVLRARGVRRRQRPAHVDALLDIVALEDCRRAYPATLSGGQQQRLAIARALAGNPGILLLDEPFANLDQDLRERILVEVRRRQQDEGVTILLATHDVDDIEAHADTTVSLA